MSTLSLCMPAFKKRASDLIIDACGLPCSCCELNSGPKDKQPVLLTSDSFLHPSCVFSLRESTDPLSVKRLKRKNR